MANVGSSDDDLEVTAEAQNAHKVAEYIEGSLYVAGVHYTVNVDLAGSSSRVKLMAPGWRFSYRGSSAQEGQG